MASKKHDLVIVSRIPDCDICKHEDHNPKPAPAVADGKTIHGPWANMCGPHFKSHGIGLGLGRGQMLVLEDKGDE